MFQEVLREEQAQNRFGNGIVTENLLIELEELQLHWFDFVKKMCRALLLRTLEVNCKGQRYTG
jgi:hypothetical protein